MNNLLTISKIHNDMLKNARAPLANLDDDEENLAFKNCTEERLPYSSNGGIRTAYIKKGEPRCFKGSMILGANATWEIITALQDPFTGNYSYSKEVTNGAASLGVKYTASEGGTIYPITRVKCVGADVCKVQMISVPTSYYIEQKSEGGDYYSDTVLGEKVIISTKKEGEINLGIRSSGKISSKSGSGKYMSVEAYIYGTNPKNFSIERELGTYFSYVPSNMTKFDLGTRSYIRIFGYFNQKGYMEFAANNSIKFDPTDFEVEFLNNKLTWKDVSESSKSKDASAEGDDEEEEFLIPEITATLSTKGGAFNAAEIDENFPGDKNGLSAGAIAGIVIAVIAVITIIAVCVWLFAFGGINKCKKDKVNGDSGNNKDTP